MKAISFFTVTDVYDAGTDVVELRSRIGMVFQRSNPFPKSIYENVTYGPRINRRPPRKELDELVESSLRKAALWDEVKDRLRSSALGLSGDSNSDSASHALWRTSRRFSCSTSPPVLSIRWRRNASRSCSSS